MLPSSRVFAIYGLKRDEVYGEKKNTSLHSFGNLAEKFLVLNFQAQALANAVFAYAANADNLGVLGDAVAMMVHKHVSFDVKAEHYTIVGECLLAALKVSLIDHE